MTTQKVTKEFLEALINVLKNNKCVVFADRYDDGKFTYNTQIVTLHFNKKYDVWEAEQKNGFVFNIDMEQTTDNFKSYKEFDIL